MFKREKYLDKIEHGFTHVPIIVLIGARQTGKTSLMNLFSEGKKCVLLNGQDSEIAALFQKQSTIEQYLKVYLNETLDGFLLLDEFQFVGGISTSMKLLTDKHSSLKILCSGSSSLDILQQVEESLAGRVRVIEVLSLSFAEYLLFNNDKLHVLYNSFDLNTESSALTMPIEQLLSEYLVYGGLPRAALAKKREEKIEILDDIYKTYLLKDVRNYIKNEYVVSFNKLLRLLAAQIGSLLNVNDLSRESGLPYKTAEDYIKLLEDMYIIKLVEPYFTNKRKVISKMKKIYFCDLGLRNMIERNFNEPDFRADNGAIFENYVMLELWRNRGVAGELNFFRTSDGTEVDFIMKNMTESKAIEVKFKNFSKPLNIKSLTLFSEEEKIQSKYIVNKTLNISYNNTKILQGFLVPKINMTSA
jgi:predicted AAA+ superfamily ATPase